MKQRTGIAILVTAAVWTSALAQDRPARRLSERGGPDEAPVSRPGQTMKQPIWGAEYAAASMMPQATLTAERMLRAGGNAFDAIVAGQAVLGLVQPGSNGLGSDAVLLIYDARQKKAYSLNAEGTAPKLATIEWYQKNQSGKIPVNDTLRAGPAPP